MSPERVDATNDPVSAGASPQDNPLRSEARDRHCLLR